VTKATDFEDKYIVGVLGNLTREREIKAWADGVSGHYERKRRMEILESARVVIVDSDDEGTFVAEVFQVAGDVESEVIPVKVGRSRQDAGSESWGGDGV